MLEKPDIRQSAGSSHPLSTPATWKLVPVEPTPEMLKASAGTSTCHPPSWNRAMWAAFLAAAPASPSPEALPASGVEAMREALVIWDTIQTKGFTQAAAKMLGSEAEEAMVIGGVFGLKKWADRKRAAALTSAPAPEDRSDA